MNRISAVFKTSVSHVLLPVVHPIGRAEALEGVRVVNDFGIPGVFLIDQGMIEREVLALMREVRDRYPTLWIGLNLLGRAPSRTLALARETCGFIDGVWCDDAGIDEREASHPRAEAFDQARHEAKWNGLYFGGVAFKYQREVPHGDLHRAAELAVPHMDVVCTSGPGTGHAADVAKVRALRAGLGDHALALASGVTADNVRSYLPYVQAFLVGTGIEKQVGVLDPVKIEALLRAMQG